MICKDCRYWLDGPRPVCIRHPKWVPHEAGDPACGEFMPQAAAVQAERDADAVEAAKDGGIVPVKDIKAVNRVLAKRRRRGLD